MSNLENFNGNQFISSLTIAEITGKEHKHLLTSIRQMEDAWINLGQPSFRQSSYLNSQNRKYPMYELTKTESLYIATKFNDDARAKVILRWEELEKKDVIKIPKTYKEALIELIAKEDIIESQQLQLAEQAPKIIAFNKVIDNSATYTVASLSDAVDIGLIKLFDILRSWNWVISKTSNGTASTRYCEEQRYGKTLFDTITIRGREINKKQFVLTRKGFEKAIEKLNKE